MGEFNNQHDSLDWLEKWREKNPVEIPEDIIDIREAIKSKLNDPDLTEAEWSELNRKHAERMQGKSVEDMYYKLATLRDVEKPGYLGLESEIAQVEDKLRQCECGSGKLYMDCHGSN